MNCYTRGLTNPQNMLLIIRCVLRLVPSYEAWNAVLQALIPQQDNNRIVSKNLSFLRLLPEDNIYFFDEVSSNGSHGLDRHCKILHEIPTINRHMCHTCSTTNLSKYAQMWKGVTQGAPVNIQVLSKKVCQHLAALSLIRHSWPYVS
jgi:hypothetical protein